MRIPGTLKAPSLPSGFEPLLGKERDGSALPLASGNEEISIRYNEDGDSVILSPEGVKKARKKEDDLEGAADGLDQREKVKAQEMQKQDRQIRQHEQAHLAASGRIPIFGPIYQMEKGPDGRMYVTGGKVNFRMPPAQSAQGKLELAQQLRTMALAPASPSAKDRSIAARAAQQINQARLELAFKERADRESTSGPWASANYNIVDGELTGDRISIFA